ncbi:nuclear transport factor 2 family protein [Flavobacterium sp.]|uniref:nuclear transport factor 2 family protein n=1 Tax=Flavobacterium sp. TaxID=239 RepID=UPI002FD95768
MTPSAIEIVKQFYTAFQNGNSQAMKACYNEQALFSDPVFGLLNYTEVSAMWEMLLKRSKGNLSITFDDIIQNNDIVCVTWIAEYSFGKENRRVKNIIRAKIKCKDGKIIEHHDSFDLWKWNRMALGWKGVLLGWTPFMKRKIKAQALQSLNTYLNRT